MLAAAGLSPPAPRPLGGRGAGGESPAAALAKSVLVALDSGVPRQWSRGYVEGVATLAPKTRGS